MIINSTFDLVVIGSGPGGHTLAEKAARLGARVAIIEKNGWGGVCTNVGCIPSKALLAVSKHYAELAKLGRMGIDLSVSATIDFAKVKRHMLQSIKVAQLGVNKILDDAGVIKIAGEAFLEGPGRVRIASPEGEQVLETKRIAIAWGSTPIVLPFMTLSHRVQTTDQFFDNDVLPERMIVVGGGVIGVELSTFLVELGVRVTLVEKQDQILPSAEPEAAALITAALEKKGVRFCLNSRLSALEVKENKVMVTLGEANEVLEGDHCLVALGRRPNLRTRELDTLGITYDKFGVTVDAEFETSVKDIFAIGDSVPGVMLAHRASAHGKALARKLFGDGLFDYTDQKVPGVVYSHPGLAWVGMTESVAREQFGEVEVVRGEYGANAVARAELLGQGFSKLIFANGKFVGATIVGENAPELISPLSLAIASDLDRAHLERWVIPHPTLSEVVYL